MWNSNPDYLFAWRRKQTPKGRQVFLCPCLLSMVSFFGWKWTVFLYKRGLLGINVSNLNTPGKGPIDRVICDCHAAVTKINANDPRCPVKQCGTILKHPASTADCAFQHEHHGFLQHTHFILLNISQNTPLTHRHTKIEFFTFLLL